MSRIRNRLGPPCGDCPKFLTAACGSFLDYCGVSLEILGLVVLSDTTNYLNPEMNQRFIFFLFVCFYFGPYGIVLDRANLTSFT
jgi:hypothetical protein